MHIRPVCIEVHRQASGPVPFASPVRNRCAANRVYTIIFANLQPSCKGGFSILRRQATCTFRSRTIGPFDGEQTAPNKCCAADQETPLRFTPISLASRNGMDRSANPWVGAATTDVGHRLVDLGIRGSRIGLEQSTCRHDLTGLAVSALGNLMINPCLLRADNLLSSARPSIVVMDFPAISETGTEQDRTTLPSTWTLHAPHAENTAPKFRAGKAELFA